MILKKLLYSVAVLVLLQCVACKPVKRGPQPPKPVEGGSKAEEDLNGILEVIAPNAEDLDPDEHGEDPEGGTGLEYDRYLRQVVEVLESDDQFRQKLENANVSDIKSGAIATHLELVNNTIRTKLDEIKRMEIQRLQELARIKMRTMSGTEVLHFIAAHGGVGVNRMDIPGHLDLRNPHSFEMKDLETLIKKTTHDLEEVDKQRREEFKTYEMEKEYEYQEKLKELPEEEKKKLQQKHEELKKKHKDHEKVNHPGSKDQFEEVWDKDDHLEDQDFDPKTFFMLHDLNGDKLWDVQEVEAVLQRELDKVYDARNSPEEDDPMERYEEMNRMREHVFQEIDKDKDFMITMEEFLAYTGKHGENQKFTEDEGWDDLDQNEEFSEDDLKEYIRQHHPERVPPGEESLRFSPEEHARQQQMAQQGIKQPAMGHGIPQQGMHQQGIPQQGMPQQGMPQQGMPQQGMPQHGIPQQGMPQQGMPQQGIPQQGMPQQGIPQQGMPQQGIPQQGMPQQGIPQQGMPQQGMAQQAIPQNQGIPQQGVPQQGFPKQAQGLSQQGQGLPQQGGQQPPGQLNQGQPVQVAGQGQGQPVQGHQPVV